jgi:hypothetical protein
MLSLLGRAPTLACLIPFLGLASLASAQVPQAILLNGVVLTQKQPIEIFSTEGPIWNVDLVNPAVFVGGHRVTVPVSIDGVPVELEGSSVLGADGLPQGGIGAENFARLLDTAAIGADRDADRVGDNLGPRRRGAVRSIFSLSEARRASDAANIIRDPQAQSQIEQNYFDLVQQCYPHNAADLPPDFLSRAGLIGNDPANWVYPTLTGGTLKSAGHIYLDPQGNEHFVPDAGLVIELAENVVLGRMKGAVRGNASRPDSFVVGDMLCIFNQDPRFGAEVLGVGEAPIPRSVFFNEIARGASVTVSGFFVGEHVLFVQDVFTDLVDRLAPILVTVDRPQFRINGNRSEARWRGLVDKPEEVDQFFAVLYSPGPNGTEIRTQFPIALIPAIETPGARYNVRLRAVPGVNLAAVTHIQMEARANVGTNPDTGLPIFEVVGSSERIDIAPFRQ